MAMQREFLRGLGLEEETVTKVINEHHSNIADAEKQANDYKTELDTANDELKNRDSQIEELKKSTTDNEELQKQLNDYKANNEQYEEKLKQVNRKNALKLKAVENGARNPDAVVKLFDMDALEYDKEGNPTNLDDKFNEFKDSEDYLFTPTKKTGRTPNEGDGAPPALSKNQIMGIKDPAERQKAIKDNIQLFN